MPKVIHINLLAHSVRKNSSELLEPFKIMFTKPPSEVAIPNFCGYNVQLPQIENMIPDFESALYCWCYAMHTAHSRGKTVQEVVGMSSELQSFMVLDPGFRQFCERYKFVAQDPKSQKEYVNWVKDLMREQGMKEAAWLRGVEEGRLEGILEGRQEGILEGTLKGRREGIEAVAAKMLLGNRSIEEVAETTGLTVDEVIELKKKTYAQAGVA